MSSPAVLRHSHKSNQIRIIAFQSSLPNRVPAIARFSLRSATNSPAFPTPFPWRRFQLVYAVGSPGPMPAFPERVAAVQALLGHLTRGLLDELPDGAAVLEPVDRPGAASAPFPLFPAGRAAGSLILRVWPW